MLEILCEDDKGELEDKNVFILEYRYFKDSTEEKFPRKYFILTDADEAIKKYISDGDYVNIYQISLAYDDEGITIDRVDEGAIYKRAFELYIKGEIDLEDAKRLRLEKDNKK